MATLSQSNPLNQYRTARTRRLRRRVYAFVIAAIALATIAYGETWVLEQAPLAPVECAAATGLALVFEKPVVTN